MLRLFCLLLIFSSPALAAPYSETGLPLPRFVSLRSEEANMRKGPGTRYPIAWVYKRKHLPLEVINEFGHWRLVRDHEDVTGWLHKGMLSAARYAMVLGEAQPLHADPELESDVILKLQPGVIAPLEECDANWCEVSIVGKEGWLPKSGIWGVYAQETVE